MFLSADQNIYKLTCHNTGDLGHEAFDSSDGDTFSLMLDACDNVFNLQRKDSGEVRKGAKQNKKKKKQRSTEERWPLSKLQRSQQRTFWYCWDVHHSTLELRSCFKVGVREWERVRKRRQLMLTHKTAQKLYLDSGRLLNKDTCSCICLLFSPHTHIRAVADNLFKAIHGPPAQQNNRYQIIIKF